VSKWTETTRIEFVQDAKRPGSKSYERYQAYSQAKYVGQALRLGAKVEDLIHDYNKKYLKMAKDQRVKAPPGIVGEAEKAKLSKFLKRMRGPSGCNFRRVQAKKLKAEEKLKKLGIDFKDMRGEKNCQETNDLQALRLAADCAASEVLAELDTSGRRIADRDLKKVLDLWAFRKNESRLNVFPEGKTWVYSDTLGLVKDRKGAFITTTPTKDYPSVMILLARWLKERRPAELSDDFPFTTISLNFGYAAKRHRDAGNVGPSMIKAFGKFKGGRLRYWPDDDKELALENLRDDDKVVLDITQGLALFDGNRAHEVEPFQGERFSLVFFSVGRYWKAKSSDLDLLRERGFVIPTDESMAMVRSLLPPPRGYQSCQSIASMFGMREKPKVYLWPDTQDAEPSGPSKCFVSKAPKCQQEKNGNLKALFEGTSGSEASKTPTAAEKPSDEEQADKPERREDPSEKKDSTQRTLTALLFGAATGGGADADQPEKAEQEQQDKLTERMGTKTPEAAKAEAQEDPNTPEQHSKRDPKTPEPGSKRMLEASTAKAKRAKCKEPAKVKPEAVKPVRASTAAATEQEQREEEAGDAEVGPTAEDLASPQFCPEEAACSPSWCRRFGSLAQVLEAVKAQPTASAVVMLSNCFRVVLRGSRAPAADLRAALELLLPGEPLPEQVVSAAVVAAFGGAAPTDEDLAEVAASRRAQQSATEPSEQSAAQRVAPLTLAGVLAAREAARVLEKQATPCLAELLNASKPDGREAAVLVQVLLGRTTLTRPSVLSALANAFVLTQPPRAVGAAGAMPAKPRAFASAKAQHASLLAMNKALALAHGETGGSLEVLLSALLADSRAHDLYGRCGARCGTPILPMRATQNDDLEVMLAELTGCAVLIEQHCQGELVQVHKFSDGSLAMFNSRQKEISSTIDKALMKALQAAVQVKECVLDAVWQRDSPEAPSGMLWTFDCLLLNGQVLVRQSLRNRRAALGRAMIPCSSVQVPPSEEFSLEDPPTMEVIESLLGDAVSAGSHGVMLKPLEREYEAGFRSTACFAALRAPPSC